jgi:Spy/CpxP family protein refolding chaperone
MIKNNHERVAAKREAGKIRQEAYNLLTPEQKLKLLDDAHLTATRQRAKLNVLIDANKANK